MSVGEEAASSGSRSPAPGTPHEIHVVSRVLLRRFTDPTTKKLAGYHLASQREYDKPPRSVGWFEQFIKHEPEAAEAEWQTIETRLPAAFKAVDDGSIFSQPDHIEVIKDCIALHWARSRVYKELHETLLESGREWHKQQWRQYNQHLLVAAFVSKYGLYPAGPEALDHINDLVYQPPEIITSGELFAARVRSFVNRARDHFKSQALQIGRVSGSEQLLIGDAPVLCFKRGESGLLRDFRAPLFEAMPVLPIGPRHVATLGGQEKWVSLESSGIEKLNLHQVLAAKDWVMYHPSSGLMPFVDMIVRAMVAAKAG